MKCPKCAQNTPDSWRPIYPQMGNRILLDPSPEIREDAPHHQVQFDWMHCANKDCGQLVVRGHDTHTIYEDGLPLEGTETWLAHPQHRVRPVDPLVPDDLARDFTEAAAILDRSYRMSAVLARKVLGDLLRRYAGLGQYGLAAQIDKFIDDPNRPYELRQNLHYLREIADFSAHTQTDDQFEAVNVDPEEAEWTLEVVERLFDYFIVGPEKDKKLRAGIDEKLKAANRRAIKPLPSEPEVPSASNGGSAEAED